MKKTFLWLVIILVIGTVLFKACSGNGSVYNQLRFQWIKVSANPDLNTTNKALETATKIMNKNNLSEKEKYLTEMVYYTLAVNQRLSEKMLAEGSNANPEKYQNIYMQIMSQIGVVSAVFTGDEYDSASADDLKEMADSFKQFYESLK